MMQRQTSANKTVQRQLGGFLIRSTSSDLAIFSSMSTNLPFRKIPHMGKIIDPTENFPEREYLTFSEKLEWARRLERIERVKAEERRKATLKQYKDTDMHKCVNREVSGITNEIVAEKSGFGSREKYRKAKFIAENADPETIAKLDADEISIHRAWKETKARINENCDRTGSEICHVAQIDHTENSAGQETGGNPKDVFRFKEAQANEL